MPDLGRQVVAYMKCLLICRRWFLKDLYVTAENQLRLIEPFQHERAMQTTLSAIPDMTERNLLQHRFTSQCIHCTGTRSLQDQHAVGSTPTAGHTMTTSQSSLFTVSVLNLYWQQSGAVCQPRIHCQLVNYLYARCMSFYNWTCTFVTGSINNFSISILK